MDQKTKNMITLAAITIGIGGLLIELVALVYDLPFAAYSLAMAYRFIYLKPVEFSFMGSLILEFFNYKTHLIANFLNVIFYGLMVSGAWFYISSKQKELRLLQFTFSVLLFVNLLLFLSAVLYLIISPDFYNHISGIMWISVFIKCGLLILLSFWVLTNLNADKQQFYHLDADSSSINASIFKRMTNWVIDTAICLSIFNLFTMAIGVIELFPKLSYLLDETTVFAITFFLLRFMYYTFFEITFSATPAKFLTATSVIVTESASPKVKQIFVRTLSRSVPFEPLSFFLKKGGWHDRWSSTTVTNQTYSSKSGNWILLTIPTFAVLGIAGFTGFHSYENYKYRLSRETAFTLRAALIDQELEQITTAHYIKLSYVDKSDFYSSDNPRRDEDVYLKIEQVDKEHVDAAIIRVHRYGTSYTPIGIEELAKENNLNLERIQINKRDLAAAFQKVYDDKFSPVVPSVKLLKDSSEYTIEDVYLAGIPDIKMAGSGFLSQDEIILSFDNCGWSAQLVEVNSLEGGIIWTNALPQLIPAVNSQQINCSSFTLKGTNYTREKKYKFSFTLEDLRKQRKTFLVEGVNLYYTLTTMPTLPN